MSTGTTPVPAADIDTVITDDTAPLDPTTLSDFVGRHVGPREADVAHMLQTLGYDSLEELIDTAVPGGPRLPGSTGTRRGLVVGHGALHHRARSAAGDLSIHS